MMFSWAAVFAEIALAVVLIAYFIFTAISKGLEAVYDKLLVLYSHSNIANICILIIAVIIAVLFVAFYKDEFAYENDFKGNKSRYIFFGLPISIGITSNLLFTYYYLLVSVLEIVEEGKDDAFLAVFVGLIPIFLRFMIASILSLICTFIGIAVPVSITIKSKKIGMLFLYIVNIILILINCTKILPVILEGVGTG